MHGKTYRNGFMVVAAMGLGLITSARGGSLDFPAGSTADPGSNWSFAVVSDPQGTGIESDSNPYVNTPVNEAMDQAIINDGASFVLVSGDLQHGQELGLVIPWSISISNQLAIWTNVASKLGRAGIPYYAVRGNHETYHKTGPNPHDAWNWAVGRYMPTNGPEGEIGMTYSFPFRNARFIGLDEFNGTKDDTKYEKVNQDWLDAQLAANTQPLVFVFGHEPAFEATIWCLSENSADRNRFWDSLGNANVRAYFCGHSHLYSRSWATISNGPTVRQLMVGTGGGALDSWDGTFKENGKNGVSIYSEVEHTKNWGYMLVSVSGNHVVMEYKMTQDSLKKWSPTDVVTWTTYDRFEYTIAGMPTNVSASDGRYTDKVLVSWDAAADASGYEVWRGTNASIAGRARIGVTTNTSFGDTNAVPSVHYCYWVRATNADGASLFSAFDTGWRGVLADFDGDGLADPFAVVNGGWTFWLSSGGYLPSGPHIFSVPGGVPRAGDFDGDGLADPAMVANGGWTFWLSSGGYLPSGPHIFSVSGGVPLVGDFDGDGRADPTMVANNNWTFWFSSGGYQPSGPYLFNP